MTQEEKAIENTRGLLGPAQHSGNVTQERKVMGYFRGGFYRFREFRETGDEATLQERGRSKPTARVDVT